MNIKGIPRKRVLWIGLIVLLMLSGLLVLVGFAIQAYRQPLGPALEAIGPTANSASTPIPNLMTTSTSANVEASSTVVCGETGVWNILILGSDAADLRGPKGSDLTRAARVDFPNQKVSIYAFPRDLWVETSSVEFTNPVINNARLGQVFYEARNRSTQTEPRNQMLDGTSATAKVMAQNFTLHFDHYMTIDLTRLPAMIDAIGGLPMNVPERITDPWIGMVIEAGQQTLNGNQVEAYARAIPDSDFARIQRNNLLLDALRQKLLDPLVWVKIPQLYQQVSDAIVTDLSPEQVTNLACLMKAIPKESIVQDAVKSEWTTAGPQESLLWDSTKVFARLKELGLIQ